MGWNLSAYSLGDLGCLGNVTSWQTGTLSKRRMSRSSSLNEEFKEFLTRRQTLAKKATEDPSEDPSEGNASSGEELQPSSSNKKPGQSKQLQITSCY